MGIGIQLWRCRIGTFLPRRFGAKFNSRNAGIVFSGGCTSLAIRLCMFTLLCIAMDVESNPGPLRSGKQTELDESTAQTILKEIRELKANQDSSAATINKKIDGLTGELKKLKQDVKDAKDDAAEAREENRELREEIGRMQQKVDQLEGQSRRENLLFFGVEGDKNETWKQSETKVRGIVTDKLGIDGDDIALERAHRLKSKGETAPIIVKFSFYKDRCAVLAAAKKLKGSPISLSEDYTVRVRNIRRKLMPFLNEQKQQGKKAKLSYDKLVIEGKSFAWNEEAKRPVPI